MPERTFPWFPVTFERPDKNLLFIIHGAHYDDDIKVVWVEDEYQGHLFTVGSIEALNDMEMRWHSIEDESLVVRPTRPDDAERWDRSIRVPLPTEIIGAILTHSIPPPTIAAAVDGLGDVHTMILETGLGLYARYSGSWIRMTDISPIEQLDIVNVPEDDLDIYDQADQRGASVNIQHLHPIDWPAASAVDYTATPNPAAAGTVTTPAAVIVASAADLPDAVAFANTNSEARWYVERRWRSLGGEDTGISLPWVDGS